MTQSQATTHTLHKALVLAARPKTLLLALSPVLLGTAAAYNEGAWRAWILVAAALGAFAIQIGTNFINDWADALRETDSHARLGPERMVTAGHLTLKQAQTATLAAFGLATCIGVALVIQGGWPIVFVGVTGLIAGWAYTAGPFPLAYHGLGELFAFVYFGPVAVITTAYLHVGRFVPSTGPWGVSMGALAAVLLGINNLRDRTGDAKSNKKTLAVRLGSRAARSLLVGWLCIALLAPVQGVSVGLLPKSTLMCLVCLPWFGWLAFAIARRDGRSLNTLLAATSLLQLSLAVMGSVVWCVWP